MEVSFQNLLITEKVVVMKANKIIDKYLKEDSFIPRIKEFQPKRSWFGFAFVSMIVSVILVTPWYAKIFPVFCFWFLLKSVADGRASVDDKYVDLKVVVDGEERN